MLVWKGGGCKFYVAVQAYLSAMDPVGRASKRLFKGGVVESVARRWLVSRKV